MMKYFKIPLVALLFFALEAHAQIKITVGQPFVTVDAREKYYFQRKDEILTVKIDKEIITLQKFSATDLSFKKIMTYSDLPKKARIEKVTQFGPHYFVCYSLYDGDNDNLFVREIDFKEGKFTGAAVPLITVKGKIATTSQFKFFTSAQPV